MTRRRFVPPFVPGVVWLDSAVGDMAHLPEKIQRQVLARIVALGSNSHPVGSKKMHGALATGETYYREKSGGYRILYVVRAGLVVIVAVGDRKDVYR